MSTPGPELAPLDRPTLVEASAGTGKTYTITTYFVRAIIEDGLSPEKILVVTYTKAATAELRVRARSRLRQALAFLSEAPTEPDALYEVVQRAVVSSSLREVERKLRGALGQMDQASIFTIHGFCQRLLQEHPLSFGVDLDLEVAESPASFGSALAVDFWASALYEEPAWFVRALRDKRVSTKRLAHLANVSAMPGVELVGPATRHIDEREVEHALALFRKAATIWVDERNEILERLVIEALNKRSYNETRIIEKWAPELDAFFAKDEYSAPPDFFERLCAPRIIVKKGRDRPTHPFFDACEEAFLVHESLDEKLDFAVFDFQRRFCEYVAEQSKRRRDETGVFSFDDLLTTVHEAVDPGLRADRLPSAPTIAQTVRAAYPLALVDEFQDTDSVQYGIFRAIYGDGAAVYVGDPKQAIYAFRGADVYSYLQAASDIGENKLSLSTNRRSDPGVVQGVNTLFERKRPPFIIEGIDFLPARAHERESRSTLSPSLDLVLLGREHFEESGAEHVAAIAANEVALLLSSDAKVSKRPIAADDIAVLCRTNEQTTAVVHALRDLNVPVSLDGGANVLDTELAAELWAVMEAVLLPGDSRALRRALLTSLVGVTPFELACMEDGAWSIWVERFRTWNQLWHDHGVLRFMQDMLATTGAEVRLASRPTARRDLTDLLHVQELLLRGQRTRGDEPVALMQWFRRLQEGTADDAGLASEDLQQRPDADQGAVRVSTIHRSKGLEYGVVFCPFTWGDARLKGFDSSVLKYHRDGALRVDLRAKEQKAHELELSKEEAKSEALRLLYVATTRAKHQCTLFWGQGSHWKDSALTYLLHDGDALKSLDDAGMQRDIEALVTASNGSIGWRRPRGERAARRDSVASDAALEPREASRAFDPSPRIASFTSLSGHEEKVRPSDSEETTSPLFAELPGGARSGLLLHAILERLDAGALAEGEGREEVMRELSLSGLDPSLAQATMDGLRAVVSTPLCKEPALPPLAMLDPDRTLRELEFTLTAGRPRLQDLAELLREHGAPEAALGYPERLRQLGDRGLRGFLRGFIDLVFESGGRWYVADYKSNRLPSYEPVSVVEAVQREHYVLQGLLYAAAAHRYLRQRLPDYEAAEHWGGTLFLFLRGMGGPGRAGEGVYFDRQSPELLEAIDRWIGGTDGSL